MLSKEEIEFNLKALSGVMLNFEDRLCDEMQERVKEVKEYIDNLENEYTEELNARYWYENEYEIYRDKNKELYKIIDNLESDKQKLIEKLEERIKSVEQCYDELLTDVGGVKIINVTGLSRKEKEEVINKRNCLLVQKHCYQEILEILKGENK